MNCADCKCNICQTLCVLRNSIRKRKRKFFTRDGSTYCVVCSAKVLKSLALHLADFCFFQYPAALLLSCFSISGAYCCLVYVCTYFAVAYIVLHLIKSQRLSRCVFIAAKFKARIVFFHPQHHMDACKTLEERETLQRENDGHWPCT